MTKTVLNVQAMTCPSCVKHVGQALAIEGVLNIDVQPKTRVVAVDHTSAVTVERLLAALHQAGYEATARPTT